MNKVIDKGFRSCRFVSTIVKHPVYLFAGKFSYIVLNKAVYEKVVEMNSKRRQCQNNPDVFCYVCGEYMMAKYRFNVRDCTKRAYKAYFGMKLGTKTTLGHPTRCANIVQKRCDFGPKAKSVRCGLGFLWYGVCLKIKMMIVIFAWWICLGGISERRKIGIILILSLLDNPYHIALKFQFSLPYLTLLQMKCYWKRWMILIAATVVLIALLAWLLQDLRSVKTKTL